jgi:simple sugar transport system ATP-binding protein
VTAEPAPAARLGTHAVVLALRDITKTFPGVVANDGVSLEVRAGEVHALLGENGAGKTTLMSVLYGLYQPDRGQVWVRGRPVTFRSPRDAIALGVGMVPQHARLIRRHTVAENVALGLHGLPRFFPTRRLAHRILELGSRYGLAVDPHARVGALSTGEQQRVEILKALIRGAEILILDEPTSALTPHEADALFAVLRRMRADGRAIIFISHKLDEVMAIADRVTVLRRGRIVGERDIADVDARALATLMVGRELSPRAPRVTAAPGPAAVVVRGLETAGERGGDALRGVSFDVHRGEIFGVAGVAGNGQRELVECLTGLRPARAGSMVLHGREMLNRSARALADAGVAHVPEDRVHMGIVPAMSVAENLILKRYRHRPFSRGGTIDRRAVADFAARIIAAYEIATPGPAVDARVLSGGNIQKLILGRELSADPSLIIAAHPTAGLDVSATDAIHRLLLQRRRDGAAVLLVSEDLDEVLALSDRVGVMFSGRMVGVLPHAEASVERVGLLMLGRTA